MKEGEGGGRGRSKGRRRRERKGAESVNHKAWTLVNGYSLEPKKMTRRERECGIRRRRVGMERDESKTNRERQGGREC